MIPALAKKAEDGDPKAKKKPGLAILIASADKHKEPDGDEEGGEDMSENFMAAVDDLADTLEVPDDKREKLATAFYALVSACK